MLVAICLATGCGRSELGYKPNSLHAASLTREGTDQNPILIAKKASEVVETWFGNIDQPKWPIDQVGLADQVLRMDCVERCAGPVGRGIDKVERGLFRKHCVSCHGLSGDGLGPAAMLLEPYPRDFRRGTFKFKSTPVGKKPTREDIHRTLHDGIPGTAMPSFRALDESEEFAKDVEDLVHYVRFLAIRGEVERRLISLQVREGVELEPNSQRMQEVLVQVVQKWADSPDDALVVPETPDPGIRCNAQLYQRGGATVDGPQQRSPTSADPSRRDSGRASVLAVECHSHATLGTSSSSFLSEPVL
jgi:hypothetical protein